MKAFAALLLFCFYAFVSATTADPACVALYPNNKCHYNHATDEPIVVSNIECGTCYSASALKASRNIAGNELTDANPSTNKDFLSGFDFLVDCETDTVQLYRAVASTTPRCSGKFSNISTVECLNLVDFSMKTKSDACNYTMRSGFTETMPPPHPVCGQYAYVWEATCGTCSELPNTSPDFGYNYYIIDCSSGLTTIFNDSDCLEAVESIEISECQYIGVDGPGLLHYQVLPVEWWNLPVCRSNWTSSDCSGEPDYQDCETVCGGCYASDVFIWGDSAVGSHTRCDTLETTFHGNYRCSENTIVSAPVPINTCITTDSGSYSVSQLLL